MILFFYDSFTIFFAFSSSLFAQVHAPQLDFLSLSKQQQQSLMTQYSQSDAVNVDSFASTEEGMVTESVEENEFSSTEGVDILSGLSSIERAYYTVDVEHDFSLLINDN